MRHSDFDVGGRAVDSFANAEQWSGRKIGVNGMVPNKKRTEMASSSSLSTLLADDRSDDNDSSSDNSSDSISNAAVSSSFLIMNITRKITPTWSSMTGTLVI